MAGGKSGKSAFKGAAAPFGSKAAGKMTPPKGASKTPTAKGAGSKVGKK